MKNMKILVIPYIVFLLFPVVCHSQQIILDKPVSAGELILFPDLNNQNAYYYLPDKISLATDKDGKPQFSFIRYVENVRSGSGQETIREGDGGGIVHAVVRLDVPDDLLKVAQRELQRLHPQARIEGPVVYKSGRFGLVSSFKEESGELTKKVVGLGSAPILEGQKAAISIRLTKLGAKILWESFKTAAPDISFTFEMEIQGYRMPVRATIEANFDEIYKSKSFQAGIAASFLAAEIKLAFDDLVKSGAIKVEQVGSDDKMESLLSTAYNKLTEMMFTPIGGTGNPSLSQLTQMQGGQPSMLDRATQLLNQSNQGSNTQGGGNTQSGNQTGNAQTPRSGGTQQGSAANTQTGTGTGNQTGSQTTPQPGAPTSQPTGGQSAVTTSAAPAGQTAVPPTTPPGNQQGEQILSSSAGQSQTVTTTPPSGQTGIQPPTQTAGQTSTSGGNIAAGQTSPQTGTAPAGQNTATAGNQTGTQGGGSKTNSSSGSQNKGSGIAIVASFQMKEEHRSGNFKIDLNKWTSDKITSRFDENIGNLSQYMNDPLHFRQINLDDPLFRQREIVAFVDGYNVADFKKYINFVSVHLQKKHEGGDVTDDEIRIDRYNFNDNGNYFKMLYGWKGDNNREKWMDYQYEVLWSFFGDNLIKENMKSTSFNTINLSPPLVRRNVELQADETLLKDAGVRLVTVNIYYKIGDKEFAEQGSLNPLKGLLSEKVDFLARNNDLKYDYEISWRLTGNKVVNSGRLSSTESILFVDELPDQNK
jgi:hypothetical protein